MRTWGPGAFDNDDALDLLDTLTGQDAVSHREITGHGYDVATLVIPDSDPELADAALAALLIAADRGRARWRLAPGLGRCRDGTAGPPDN